jgi:hypothetical protein
MKNFIRAVSEGRYALYFVGGCVAAIAALHFICVNFQGEL